MFDLTNFATGNIFVLLGKNYLHFLFIDYTKISNGIKPLTIKCSSCMEYFNGSCIMHLYPF